MRRFATSFAFSLIVLTGLTLGRFLQVGVQAAVQPPAQAATPDPAASPQFYTAHVKPIFDTACGKCHLNGNHRGAFNMDTREALLKGGRDGAVVVPGDPEHSLLIKLIRHEGPKDDPMDMPPHAPKLSDADIATVTQWVKAGAVMP